MANLSVWPVVVASVVFVVTYVVILSERVHRTIIALVGAVAMMLVGAALGFYPERDVYAAIDFQTITLLFGMMVLVGILKGTGVFTYLAVRAAKISRGHPRRLFVALGLLTAVVSMFLDNVTTIIVIAPVTVSIAEVIGIRAVPLLVGEAVLSNIGGVATLIGDPPNILIGSAARLGFVDFLVHLGPIVLVTLGVVVVLLVLIFRGQLRPLPASVKKIAELDERRALVDPKTARRLGVVLGGTILLYLVHGMLRIGPDLVALIGASAALLWVRPSVDEILREVHWDVLLFFFALFIIVGGMNAAGVLAFIAEKMVAWTTYGIAFAAVAVLWISAFLSAVVDNIPLTIAMLPIIAGLAEHGVDVVPLWWALALGVGFGGNGTPIGSSAGVVVLSIGEKGGMSIDFRTWVKSGLPAMLTSCAVGSIALFIAIEMGVV